MRRDDEAAITAAAEARMARERDQRMLDAARAELPRAMSEDARERRRWLVGIVRRLVRMARR